MRLMPQLMQFEIGISTNRYFPAIGTAGFERLAVSGYNLVPAPPPNITANISRLMVFIFMSQTKLLLLSFCCACPDAYRGSNSSTSGSLFSFFISRNTQRKIQKTQCFTSLRNFAVFGWKSISKIHRASHNPLLIVPMNGQSPSYAAASNPSGSFYDNKDQLLFPLNR